MPALAQIGILAPFQQQLVGNWKNLDFGKDAQGNPIGGDENPLSYNIMPLPQISDPDGYILKNFKYPRSFISTMIRSPLLLPYRPAPRTEGDRLIRTRARCSTNSRSCLLRVPAKTR